MIITTKEEQEALDYVKVNSPLLYKFYEFVDSKAKWSGKQSGVYFYNFTSHSYGWRSPNNSARELHFVFRNSDDIYGNHVIVNVELPKSVFDFRCSRNTTRSNITEIYIDSLNPNYSFDEIEKFIDDGLKHFRKLNNKNQIKNAAEKIKAMSYQSRLLDVIPDDVQLKPSNSGESIYGLGQYSSSIHIKKLKTKQDTFTIKFDGSFSVTEDQLIEFVKGFASGYPKKKKV